MTWTTPITFQALDVLEAAQLNVMQANLNALKNPPSDNYELNEGSDYTTTSTSFTNVDGTNLSLSLTTTGGDILVGFAGTVTRTASALCFDVTLDGTRVGLDDGIISTEVGPSALCFMRLITGVSAGAHTLNLQWKVYAAATGTLYAGAGTAGRDLHPQFWAREVS